MPPRSALPVDVIASRCRLFAELLAGIAVWTLLIKVAVPVACAIAERLPPGTYVMWDLWWVAHLLLAHAFLRRPLYAYPLALSVSVAEIGIVLGKFVLYLPSPDLSFFSLNWFVNKLAVLGTFAAMLPFLLRPEVRRFLGGSADERIIA